MSCYYSAVVIGFKNSFEAVIEGGRKTVCAKVKPEGLRLDPFDRVPLSVQTNPGMYYVLFIKVKVLLVHNSLHSIK